MGYTPGCGRFQVHCPLAPGAKPLLSHPHFRHIKRATHFWSSHTTSQRTPISTPDLSAQHCRGFARARVFSCLTIQKFLIPEASVWGREILMMQPVKSGWRIPPTQCLLLGQRQTDACYLPLQEVQGLWFTSVSLYGVLCEGFL